MFTLTLTAPWRVWAAALAAPLHRRLAWRLSAILVGILLASGRRTASSWFRAADVGTDFRSYYYFLDSVGRKTRPIAAVLLRIVSDCIESQQRLVFALDDTPTKRYGPFVQGAGIHHNPTPGPAGGKFLYGHSWVSLSQIVPHPRWGVIGLPLLGDLYVRQVDLPGLPREVGIRFRTKPQMAADLVRWPGQQPDREAPPAWIVVDGADAKREFLKPALQAGFVVVARLRKDAALCDLPPVVPPGQKRRRGRPPIYGKNHLSLAKRAGQRRGWTEVTIRTTAGRSVTKLIKTFLATWRPAAGAVRGVILKESDGSWRAFLCSATQADVADIVQAIHDRWAIEQNYHDLKEVERIEQVQLRRYWANVGALHLNLWSHTLIEVWAWDRDAAALCDRGDRPWDDATRRPSHADRRRALQREMLVSRVGNSPPNLRDRPSPCRLFSKEPDDEQRRSPDAGPHPDR